MRHLPHTLAVAALAAAATAAAATAAPAHAAWGPATTLASPAAEQLSAADNDQRW